MNFIFLYILKNNNIKIKHIKLYEGFLEDAARASKVDGYIPTEQTFNQVKLWIKKLVGCYVKFVTYEDKEELIVRVDRTEVFDVDDCEDCGDWKFSGEIYINGIRVQTYSPILIISSKR